MKEKIPLEPAQFLRGDGNAVPKSECPAQGGTFPFQVGVDDFLHVDRRMIPEQGANFSFEADVGVDPKTTETTLQVTAREDFARLSISRQQ